MFAALAVLAWKLSPSGVGLLPQPLVTTLYVGLFLLFLFQTWNIYRVNAEMLKAGSVPEFQRYSFRQVAILDINYFITFGSELAVVSMLPAFFAETFTTFDVNQIVVPTYNQGTSPMRITSRFGGFDVMVLAAN